MFISSSHSKPLRIGIDRRALPVLIGRDRPLPGYRLTVETDRHGETVAVLERVVVQAVPS